jgi:hypothetical protein
VIRRIEQEGVIARIRNAQAAVLNSLLATQRLHRLVEYEALAVPGETPYRLPEMLNTLRRSVWGELYSGGNPGVYRRGLQRAYLDAVDRQLNPPPLTAAQQQIPELVAAGQLRNSDVRAALRGELLELERLANAAANRGDAMSRLHWRDVAFEIDRILRSEDNRR